MCASNRREDGVSNLEGCNETGKPVLLLLVPDLVDVSFGVPNVIVDNQPMKLFCVEGKSSTVSSPKNKAAHISENGHPHNPLGIARLVEIGQ